LIDDIIATGVTASTDTYCNRLYRTSHNLPATFPATALSFQEVQSQLAPAAVSDQVLQGVQSLPLFRLPLMLTAQRKVRPAHHLPWYVCDDSKGWRQSPQRRVAIRRQSNQPQQISGVHRLLGLTCLHRSSSIPDMVPHVTRMSCTNSCLCSFMETCTPAAYAFIPPVLVHCACHCPWLLYTATQCSVMCLCSCSSHTTMHLLISSSPGLVELPGMWSWLQWAGGL
jgi:hypothetical protein